MTAPDRLSVAHVLWSGKVGGIERLVCDLAGEQVRQGLGVTVAFGRGEGPFVEMTANRGAQVVDLDLASGYDLRPSPIAHGAGVLRRVDVIHLHAFNLPLACITLLARTPVVYTEHGNFGVGTRVPRQVEIKQLLQRLYLRSRVRQIAAYSSPAASRMADLYKLDRSRITVVENGVVLTDDILAATRSPMRDDHLVVAFVGRFADSKRIDRLLDALARARSRHRIDVLLVGGGPLEDELRARAMRLELQTQVRFLGYRDDVGALLRGTDVFVQPGQGEQFGLAALEACAQGAVPILFDDGLGGPTSVPPDGAVVRSVGELADTLDAMVGAHVLSDEARQRRAAWVREKFSISKTYQQYFDLYCSAVLRAPR